MSEDKEERAILVIPNMSCSTCTIVIEKNLKKLKGVKEARVSYILEKAYVDYDPSKVSIDEIERTINKIGYKVVRPGKSSVR